MTSWSSVKNNGIASSIPGIEEVKSPIIPEIGSLGSIEADKSCMLEEGSISIQDRLSIPVTFLASLPNFSPKASDKL
ncbi:hypothetical protein WICPIJ_006468 [Wickerhamomyces pijperi]|uniref:Uncharacterized protein n=1 Tax=Wickerhamomyces pijperi TaxID=599730 RepID=A0A9P8Q201_WICPI|nr:hypothetical protein WICPIJ_006468 [Wickerhamomyces pijperi]